MNDHQMIHLIKNKDYTGLEQLIDSYGSSILMTIHRILQAPPEQSEWSDVAEEIAQQLDLQTTAIYNHLSRGRKLLKKIWKERMNRDEF